MVAVAVVVVVVVVGGASGSNNIALRQVLVKVSGVLQNFLELFNDTDLIYEIMWKIIIC